MNCKLNIQCSDGTCCETFRCVGWGHVTGCVYGKCRYALAPPSYELCYTQPAAIVDPVPGLIDYVNGDRVTTNIDSLATGGTVVQGVAADGVTQLLLRIPAQNAGDRFDLTLFNDASPSAQSSSADEDGALGNPGGTTFSASGITVTAVNTTDNGAMAFAIYRAPIDFPREHNIDDLADSRTVTINIQDQTTGNVTNLPITILRPPVALIHGIWSDSYATWGKFAPLYSFNNSAGIVSDPRFFIKTVDYNHLVGPIIKDTDPSYKKDTDPRYYRKLWFEVS